MVEPSEECEFVCDFKEPMEEASKGVVLSSQTETLAREIEEANTVDVSDSGVCVGIRTEDSNMVYSVSDDKQVKADAASVEDIEDTVGSVTGVETKDKFDKVQSSVTGEAEDRCDGEMISVAGKKAYTEMDNNKMDVDSKQANEECEIKHALHSESAKITEESTQFSQGKTDEGNSGTGSEVSSAAEICDGEEITNVNQKEENSEAMEVDFAAEEQVGKGVKIGGGLDNAADESAGESVVPIQQVQLVEADGKDSSVVKEMETDEPRNDVDLATNVSQAIGSVAEEQVEKDVKVGGSLDNAADKTAGESVVPTQQVSLAEADGNDSSVVKEMETDERRNNVDMAADLGQRIEYVAEEQVEKDVKVGSSLDNDASSLDNDADKSAGESVVRTQHAPLAEADGNDSSVVEEMETDEHRNNVDLATDLSQTVESADSANPNSPSKNAATGEVEPLDHNALFDPGSDIANFIDFSGVSCWSGNIQDLKTETGNVSLQEDKIEVATVDCKQTLESVDATVDTESHDNQSLNAEGIQNEPSETCVSFGAESPGAVTECPREVSDAIMGSEEDQVDKDHEGLDMITVYEQDAMREEDDTTHEAPSIDPNQKDDAEMEENPNNFDYCDDGTYSDIKTNGVKRKADVLSEDPPGEGRKTVSLAKVSFAQRPSFKIGACIARAASQMAGSPSVLKGSNFGDETLFVESFVSQLHCAATDPVKENSVSDIAVGFFLDFRNSLTSQHVSPENVNSKVVKTSNSNAGGTETFEFEDMGDTYWTDRMIHNGVEEQTPPTEKGNYQMVPVVESKPAQVQRTRRPYRRRQSRINVPLPAPEKPANFDENAPAELIMKFSESDTIPPETSLSKMFKRFGPIRESETEVDIENNRARVVFKKGGDAKVAYNSAGRFNIFGTKTVNYELSHTITETFKVQPYVVSLGEEDAALCPTF